MKQEQSLTAEKGFNVVWYISVLECRFKVLDFTKRYSYSSVHMLLEFVKHKNCYTLQCLCIGNLEFEIRYRNGTNNTHSNPFLSLRSLKSKQIWLTQKLANYLSVWSQSK